MSGSLATASRSASVRCAVSSVISRSDSGRKPSSSSSLSVGGWPTGEDGAREVADAPFGLAAEPCCSRSHPPLLLAFARRHRLLVLGAHIAALDVQGAVAADADEDAGTRDLRRIVDDGALLELAQRRLDLAQARVDLLRDLLGVGVLLLQLVQLRLESIARLGLLLRSAAPPCR